MAVNTYTISAAVMKHLNAVLGSTYDKTVAQTSADPKYNVTWVQDTCRAAINEFLAVVASIKDHPDQLTLSTEDGLASARTTGADIDGIAKIGDFLSCRVTYVSLASDADTDYYPAMKLPAERVRQHIADISTFTLSTPWYVYAIDAGRLYHPGTGALLRYIAPYTGNGDLDTSIDRYHNGIVALALAMLLPFMGVTDTAAQHYLTIAMQAKQEIAAAKESAPVPMAG